MAPSPDRLLHLALRTCRDAEIVTEEREEVDLAHPDQPRRVQGWGIRVHHEDRLGFSFGPSSATPEALLESALSEASQRAPRGLHLSLPPARPLLARDDPAPGHLEASLERLQALVLHLDFLLPSLVPDATFRIQARVFQQRLGLYGRGGSRRASRTLFQLALRSREAPLLETRLFTADPALTPAEPLCRLAWQAGRSQVWSEAPGEALPALFTPWAAATLVEGLARGPLDARNMDPSRPLLGLHTDLTLHDDGTLPGAPGTTPFDGEGVPRGRVALLREGRLETPLADRAQARRLGLPPRGLAVRGWGRPPEPGYSNLDVAPGRASMSELLERTEEGLLLDALSLEADLLDPGLFRARAEAAYLIHRGRLAARIPPVTVEGRYEEILGAGLLGLSRERSRQGRVVSPGVATARLRLTPLPDPEPRSFSEPLDCWW